jgi:ABC-2 type transport system permease protein
VPPAPSTRTLPSPLRVARLSAGLGLRLILAYRLEVAITVVSASVVALLNWSLWTAIFQGRTEVAGRGLTELTTYVVVAWVLTTFYGTRVDEVLSGRFRSGDIAIDLLRPWDLQLHSYSRDLGRAAGALVMTTTPLFLWIFLLLPLQGPRRLATWALFLVSLLLAHAISFGFAWLVGMAGFWMRNASGLAHLKATVIGTFSGAVIPLDLYPEPFRSFVLLLPFQGMSHTPADIFVERLPPEEAWKPLLVQLFWALGLLLLGRLAWAGARRSIVVQGG